MLEPENLKVYFVPPNLDLIIGDIAERINIANIEAVRSSVLLFNFITKHMVDGWICKLVKEGEEEKTIPFVKP